MKKHRIPIGGRSTLIAGGLAGALTIGLLAPIGASSHREAPAITEDQVADNTDVYAFVSPDRPDTVTLVANWIPLEEPAAGPNFYRFGDDVLYEINVDNNGDSGADISYEFRFKTQIRNPETFLYNTGPVTSLDDPDLNVVQTYSVTRVQGGHRQTIGENLVVAPANVGPRSTPNYEQNLGSKAVYDVANGHRVFAGPRDDPFFVDLGSVFDLAGLRPFNEAHAVKLPAADGVDGLAGYNVHTAAIQVPISELTGAVATAKAHDANADGLATLEGGKKAPATPDPVIGVWSATYRRQTRVFGNGGDDLRHKGNWVQVSRLGMPLVNELVIPLGEKDRFNASPPWTDGQFAGRVLDPEPARLIPQLYPGVTVPPAPRNDLAAIFLTGVPDLNQPVNVVASEMIRLNTSIKPTIADPNQQSRLGLLGGETDGFPNGRRLVDDVVDIELRALAGATPFTPAFNVAPNNQLGDGVDANDRAFLTSFPYVAAPTSGYDS
jgi:hypothetical protein